MTNNRRKYLKVRAWKRLLEKSGSAPRSASAVEFAARLLREENSPLRPAVSNGAQRTEATADRAEVGGCGDLPAATVAASPSAQ